MKIKYVGTKKGGERAFREETGIEWFAGMVEDVPAAVAKKMLQHPDVFVSGESEISLSNAVIKPVLQESAAAGIPAWAAKGIDVGLTDAQLESLAQVGGPETESGARLWLELTGKAFNTEPPEPKYIMRKPDGIPLVLDGMSRDKLKDIAAELRVPVHPNSGEEKFCAALVAAYPLKK